MSEGGVSHAVYFAIMLGGSDADAGVLGLLVQRPSLFDPIAPPGPGVPLASFAPRSGWVLPITNCWQLS